MAADHQVPPELRDYQLTGVEVVTKDGQPRVIGNGSYARVIELNYQGLKCAGKEFHSILYEGQTLLDKKHILAKIVQECGILAKMRHPHIVQFLGVFYRTDSASLPIVLVMEFLPTNLTECIEKHGNQLPEEINYTILEDIACALSYLHSKPKVTAHRDLSTNNILLTLDMRAKISDLGVAKDLSTRPSGKMTTIQPGTPDYMPPEALKDSPIYGLEIDIFSFGVVMLAVICGELPTPQENGAATQQAQPPTEAARRQKYIDQVTTDSMKNLIVRCLDKPSERPTAGEVQRIISREKLALPIDSKGKLHIIQESKNKDGKIDELKGKLQTLKAKITDLKERVGQLEGQVKRNEIDTDIERLIKEENENLKEQVKKYKEKEETHFRDMTQNHNKIHDLEKQRNKALRLLTSKEELHLLHHRVRLKFSPLKEPGRLHTPIELSPPMTAIQCTLIGSTLYFGGGETSSQLSQERNKINFLTLDNTDDMIQETPCPVIHFGLGNIGGKLVVVGGRAQDGKTLSNSVYVLNKHQSIRVQDSLDGASTWNADMIPCLSAPRARVCVISQTEDESSVCIAACGGRVLSESKSEENTSMVEVYHRGSPHWVTVTSLPAPRAALRVTVLHKTAYLVGGYGQNMADGGKPDCYSIPLCNLFTKGQAIAWTVMKDVPAQSAAPAHLCGTLLAIGGSSENGKPIHAYNPNKRQWVRIADLVEGLSHATAAALPNGRVVIIGGRNESRDRNKKIFIANITEQIL